MKDTRTFITPTKMVDVVSLTTKTEKTAHQVLKEYVEERTGTDLFNDAFDKAFEIGLEQGTQMYDMAIEIILDELKIPFKDVQIHMASKGIHI